MAFRDNDIQMAKVTLYYDSAQKRLLPYVKVTRYDDQGQYDHKYEYYTPCKLRFGISVPEEQIREVVIERRAAGDYPQGDRDTTAIHNYPEN